eukprot:364259-Chlamydomonas_euryale.AAC.1
MGVAVGGGGGGSSSGAQLEKSDVQRLKEVCDRQHWRQPNYNYTKDVRVRPQPGRCTGDTPHSIHSLPPHTP